MNIKNMKSKRGFTLIELMVVVSIIGLLSSIVLAATNTAREKGRNSRRIQDIRQLQNALELYRLSNNAYPLSDSATLRENSCTPVDGVSGGGVQTGGWGTPLVGLMPTYFKVLPNDPKPSSVVGQNIPADPDYCYTYISRPRNGAVDTFRDCVDAADSTKVYDTRLYEYAILYSVEPASPAPTSGIVPYWGDNPTLRPQNRCLLGPKR